MTHTSTCTAITFLNNLHKQTHVCIAYLFLLWCTENTRSSVSASVYATYSQETSNFLKVLTNLLIPSLFAKSIKHSYNHGQRFAGHGTQMALRFIICISTQYLIIQI